MLRTLASSTIGSVRASRVTSTLWLPQSARRYASASPKWLTDEEAANAKLLEAVKSRVDQFQTAQDVSVEP